MTVQLHIVGHRSLATPDMLQVAFEDQPLQAHHGILHVAIDGWSGSKRRYPLICGWTPRRFSPTLSLPGLRRGFITLIHVLNGHQIIFGRPHNLGLSCASLGPRWIRWSTCCTSLTRIPHQSLKRGFGSLVVSHLFLSRPLTALGRIIFQRQQQLYVPLVS